MSAHMNCVVSGDSALPTNATPVLADVPPVFAPAIQEEPSLPEEPVPESVSQKVPDTSHQWGQGVTFMLPDEFEAFDVVSGVFNGKSPSKEIEAQVALSKEQGFKPYSLALYPSTTDPAITLGHLVMIKK